MTQPSNETLVDRLRQNADRMGSPDRINLAHEAADEIERLRALLTDLLVDYESWGCAPAKRYYQALLPCTEAADG